MNLGFYGAPAIMFVVSLTYFLADARRPAYGVRAISSAHDILGLLLYFGALLSNTNPQYRPYLAIPYAVLYILPVAAIVVSFFTFRGTRLVHLLQIPNLLALFWSLFVGGMAVTGDWL
jgi:uncharacterized membrane protein